MCEVPMHAQKLPAYVSPIPFVPDDILHDIFHLVVASSWDSPTTIISGDDHAPHHTGVLELSCVCRYWRDLTVNTPMLWTYLFVEPRFTVLSLRVHLERSADAPLHVAFKGSVSALSSLDVLKAKAQLISAHAHRIVDFLADDHLQSKELSAVLTPFERVPSAPILRRLILESEQQWLSPSLFARKMPALREITVKGASMAWFPYRGLTVLELYDQLVSSLSDLLWTLQHCPQLTRLKLGLLGALPIRDAHQSGVTSPDSSVRLARLRELYLRSHVHVDIICILSHISFPPSTRVDLRFFEAPPRPVDVVHYCPSLRPIAERIHTITIELTASAWSPKVTLSSPADGFVVRWEWVDLAQNNLHAAALSMVPLPALHHLTIRANSYRLRRDRWCQILANVPKVTSMELEITNSMVLEFLEALGGASEPCVPCPELERLVIMHIEEHERVFVKLADTLRDRARRGVQLELLEISLTADGNVMDDTLQSLCDIIGTVLIKRETDYDEHAVTEDCSI